MLKKVGCLLIITLVIFSLNSCAKDALAGYSKNIKEVYKEWDNFKAVNTNNYSDISFLNVWN